MHMSTTVWSAMKVADKSSAIVPFSQVLAAPAEPPMQHEIGQIAAAVRSQGLQQRRRV